MLAGEGAVLGLRAILIDKVGASPDVVSKCPAFR